MAYSSSSTSEYQYNDASLYSAYQTPTPSLDTAPHPSVYTYSNQIFRYPPTTNHSVVVQARPASSLASKTNYVYKALRPNQIRLLKLDSSAIVTDFWQPPHCNLHTVNLAQAPPYIALSYRWDGHDKIVRIDGRDLKIKSNLYNFLCYFRRDAAVSKDTYIWVDQICIDQLNLDERNQQVRFMSEIYKNCTFVTAWLGQDTDTRVAAQNFLQAKTRNDLLVLLNNHYFNRLWIVQEVLLAPKVRVLCGETWLEFHDMLDVAAEDNYWVTPHVRSVATILIWDSLMGRESRTLGNCLERYSGNLTQDPRDKIYGLLGLVEEHERPEADYNKTVAEVYVDALEIIWKSPVAYSQKSFLKLVDTLSRNMGFNPQQRHYVTISCNMIGSSGPQSEWFEWNRRWLTYLENPHQIAGTKYVTSTDKPQDGEEILGMDNEMMENQKKGNPMMETRSIPMNSVASQSTIESIHRFPKRMPRERRVRSIRLG
jgi:hypothetical protein